MPKLRDKLPEELRNDVSEHLFNRLEKLTDNSGYIEFPSPWGVFSTLRKVIIEKHIKENSNNSALQRNFGITIKSIYNAKKRISNII